MIHAGNKGKAGEREVVTMLGAVIAEIVSEISPPEWVVKALNGVVQRNQNQSAAGGGDIMIFGLCVEVKRQETLSLDAWWRQACKSAERNNDVPVLIYRQNRKSWKVLADGFMPVPDALTSMRVEIELSDFLRWFKQWARIKIEKGEIDRV